MSFLEEAINLSEHTPGGPFGAIIVKDSKIIGRGSNSVIPNKDPTAHAEMIAIRDACKYIDSHSLTGCILFTSCEPCAMCMAAAYWSGITEINYANTRLDAESIGFSDKYIYEQLSLDNNMRDIHMNHYPIIRAKEIFLKWNGKKY